MKSRVVKHDFAFTSEEKNRPLHIYLPAGYDESEESYPVMYFFDGHNLFYDEDATYGKSWGLKTFLDKWGKDMIIVGIECGHEGEERLSEYLPYPASGGHFAKFAANGEETMQWIINEVKPFIDETYRTCPFRECTAIGGASMGGLMALYAVIHHNMWFSKAACISCAIGFCMPALQKDMEANQIDPDTRVFLSWGTLEAWGIQNVWQEDTHSHTYQWNRKVADYVEECDATAMMYSQVGGGHCEADWEKLVPRFMNFLWRG